jgi:uncharacterized protein YodC (DUF2158 family)
MSNQDQFKAGDVVCLKSSSVDMTIQTLESYEGSDHIDANCIWFVNGELKTSLISVNALKPSRLR